MHVKFSGTQPGLCRAPQDYSWLLAPIAIAKATPNKFPVSRPLLKYICMRAGGPFPLFHYYFKWIRSHLMQLFEYYLSPPILQSSLSRVFSHVLGNNSLRDSLWRCCVINLTSAYSFYPSIREKSEIMEEYGDNGILVLTGNRCGRWTENRKFSWSCLTK